MSSVAQFHQVVNGWASSKPAIRRAWLFGSVVKGSAAPNDLDVAIELDQLPGPDLDELWIHEAAKWRHELQAMLPLKLDLELFDPSGSTPAIAKYLAAGKRLVYERAS